MTSPEVTAYVLEKVTDAVSYVRPARRPDALVEAGSLKPDPFLLGASLVMRTLWFIPISMFAVSAGFLLRSRRRRQLDVAATTGPVSADWLAHARGHEEQEW